MENVKICIQFIYDLLNLPISIYGYTFTIWQVLILFGIAAGVGCIIGFLLGGD